MRQWNRIVSIATPELGEYLQGEIQKRWPVDDCPFHIEVLGEAGSTGVEVHVWNRDGVDVTRRASPEEFLGAREKSPTVAAVLKALESALAQAQGASWNSKSAS